MTGRLTILHTNDTHGRIGVLPKDGSAPLPDRIREATREFPDAILLDAGDAVTAGNLGFRIGGEPVLGTMSDLGYAAMALGNRETHPRKELFPLKLDRARFPVLSANLVAKGDAPPIVRPYVVLDRPGVRVGIFGVTVPMFTRKQWSQPLCDYWFGDPIEAAREQTAALRSQVDVLVALTHIGYRQDLLLAEACPELDLLIGGHSHTDLTEPTWVGSVPVVQAKSHGFYLGIAELRREEGRWRLTHWEKRPLRSDAPS